MYKRLHSPHKRGSRFTRKGRVAAGRRAIRTFAFEQSRSSSQVIFPRTVHESFNFHIGGGGSGSGSVSAGLVPALLLATV